MERDQSLVILTNKARLFCQNFVVAKCSKSATTYHLYLASVVMPVSWMLQFITKVSNTCESK